ncbi:hypothetical protein ABPG72_020469 [Tetrahymena utriculariae]
MKLVQDISINFLSEKIKQDECKYLAEIFKNQVNLKKLQIKLYYDAAELLGSSFQYLKNLESIHLSLFPNYYNDKANQNGIISIGNGLTHLVNLQQLSLTLYTRKVLNNFNHIIQGIKSLSSLESLKFYINTDCQQISEITDCINSYSNLQSEDLNFENYSFLSLNNLILNENQINLAENQQEQIILLEEQKENYLNLTKLAVQFCQYEDSKREDINQFIQNIKKFININYLYLTFSQGILFSSNQSKLICNSLINLQNFNKLTLILKQSNGFRSQSDQQLGMAFQSLTQLENLHLEIGDFNQINKEGAKYLAEGIKFLLNLTHFEFLLDNCNIQKQGAISIGNCLQYLINLRVLFLQINQDKIESD